MPVKIHNQKPVRRIKKRKRKTVNRKISIVDGNLKIKTGHYITGIHISPKCLKPVHYRSSWEKTVAVYLDNNSDVLSYSYETIKIPYLNNPRSKKISNYFPDYIIRHASGITLMVEVKRKDKISDPKVIKKAIAGRNYCDKKKNWYYQIWSDLVINQLKKLNALLILQQKPEQ